MDWRPRRGSRSTSVQGWCPDFERAGLLASVGRIEIGQTERSIQHHIRLHVRDDIAGGIYFNRVGRNALFCRNQTRVKKVMAMGEFLRRAERCRIYAKIRIE